MELAQTIGVSFIDRDATSGNPSLADDEHILSTFEDVQLVLGTSDQGLGVLYITETRIIWLSKSDSKLGFGTDFVAISMHAIANDEGSVAGKPYLYVQIARDDDYDAQDNEEDTILPELQLIPADGEQLELLFQAFCDGAVRNPDEDAEDEAQGSLFFDQDEALAGAADSLTTEDIHELVGSDPDRFDDPEEEEEPPANGTS